jgi:hypothetical protein
MIKMTFFDEAGVGYCNSAKSQRDETDEKTTLRRMSVHI